jgi:prepilin-type processing-associated H-X9-DG protein
LLTVITIVGILVAMLLPAVQSARERTRILQCANNLRQVAVAAHNFHCAKETFPPGTYRKYYAGTVTPKYRGPGLLMYLLPYFEEDNLGRQLDFTDTINNTTGGTSSVSATIVSMLICPDDIIRSNPVQNNSSGRWFGVASYGGCGGTRSFNGKTGTLLKTDGIFFCTGPNSVPTTNQSPIRAEQVRDGLSNTLLLGERSHYDPNYDSFYDGASWDQYLSCYGWWNTCGGMAVGDATMSTYAPLNYRMPASYDNRASLSPAANTSTAFSYYTDLRVCAFGSQHPGGANFAMADGSVRFIADGIATIVYQALSTRDGGELPAEISN